MPALLAVALAASLLSGGGGDSGAKQRGAVARIDPGSGRLISETALSGRPTAVAAGAGTVWIASNEEGKLWRLRPGRAGLTDIDSVGSPRDIAFYRGRMYVAADGPKSWRGTSPHMTRPAGLVRAGSSCSRAASPPAAPRECWSSGCPNVERLVEGAGGLRIAKQRFLPFRDPLTAASVRLCQCDMAAGGGAVWVLGDAADPRVWKLDAKRAAIVGTATLPFAIGRGVAFAGGSVWVAAPQDDLVARLDAQTMELTERVRVGRGPDAIAANGSQVWVGNWLDGTLSRIDARTGRVTQTVELHGRPVELAFGSGGLWVALDES